MERENENSEFTNDAESEKGDIWGHRLTLNSLGLNRLDVFCLPTLGSFDHVELDGLTLLQALEAARLDR